MVSIATRVPLKNSWQWTWKRPWMPQLYSFMSITPTSMWLVLFSAQNNPRSWDTWTLLGAAAPHHPNWSIYLFWEGTLISNLHRLIFILITINSAEIISTAHQESRSSKATRTTPSSNRRDAIAQSYILLKSTPVFNLMPTVRIQNTRNK